MQGVVPKKLSVVHKDPTWEDMLIAYATVPGYVANRNIYRGTWFVESICQVLSFVANATAALRSSLRCVFVASPYHTGCAFPRATLVSKTMLQVMRIIGVKPRAP